MRKSIGRRILEELLKPKFKYKGLSVNMLGLPAFQHNFSKKSFSNEIARLRNRGFIESKNGCWYSTKQGKQYLIKKQNSLIFFISYISKSAPKNLLVMFDIPENRKAEREWFRFHLKRFGYVMIQKSVWVGPSPLPADFLSYLKEIKLEDCIKTFKLARPYEKKNN